MAVRIAGSRYPWLLSDTPGGGGRILGSGAGIEYRRRVTPAGRAAMVRRHSKERDMPPLRLSLILPAGLVLALALLPVACGPRPAESPPIQRGTALPPPGVSLTPAR
jgi:hypothetical protein